MKKIYKSLKEHAIKIMNFIKKKMNPFTKEQKKSLEKTKTYSICKKHFKNKYANDKKLEINAIIHVNTEVLRTAHAI